jgi:hypothetical protein
MQPCARLACSECSQTRLVASANKDTTSTATAGAVETHHCNAHHSGEWDALRAASRGGNKAYVRTCYSRRALPAAVNIVRIGGSSGAAAAGGGGGVPASLQAIRQPQPVPAPAAPAATAEPAPPPAPKKLHGSVRAMPNPATISDLLHIGERGLACAEGIWLTSEGLGLGQPSAL